MKGKTLKLFLLFTLVLAIVASLVGCGGKKPANAQEELDDPNEDLDVREIDMEGYTFRIAQWWDAGPDNNKARARQKRIEEKYNCRIEYITVSWDQIVSKFTSSVLSGEPMADIILFEMTRALPVFAEADLIIPVDDYFDFDDPKWPTVIKQTGRYAGKQYGFNDTSSDISGIFYNKELIRNQGLQDPYLLASKKRWTWDAFLEIAKGTTKDLDGDGENDIWGLAIQGHNLYSPFVLSNDANIINVDDNGKATYTLDDPNAIEALQFFQDLHNKHGVVAPVADYTDWYEAPRKFVGGGIAMFFGQAWDGQDIKQAAEFDYGFVHFPMGPKASDYMVPIQAEAKIYVMPKHAKHPREAAMIFEEISDFNNDASFTGWIKSFVSNHNEIKLAEEMINKGKVTMYLGYPTFSDMLFDKICSSIIVDNMPADEFAKKFKDEAQELIDEEYKK